MRRIDEIRKKRAARQAAIERAEYDRVHAPQKWEYEFQCFVKEQREVKAKRLAEKEQDKKEVVEEPVVALEVEAPVAEKPKAKKKKIDMVAISETNNENT